jgi:hypothetical protein
VQDVVAPNENSPVGLSAVAVKAGAAPHENPTVGLSVVAVKAGAAPHENPTVGLSIVAVKVTVKAGAVPNENPPVGLSGVAVLEGAAPNEKEWKQEGIEGVFNKNCMISYPNYKFIFCIWALNKFSTMIDSK